MVRQSFVLVKNYKHDLVPGLCVKKRYLKDKICKVYKGVVVCTFDDALNHPIGVVLYDDGDVVESEKFVLDSIGAFYNYLFL